MIGRRAVLALSLFSALLLCSFLAQSASAAPSTNTTGVTCGKALGDGGFNDAHCDEVNAELKGNFAHSEMPPGTTTSISVTNEKVTETTKKSESVTLTGVVGGLETAISCGKLKADTTKSFIHNITSGENHTVTGEVKLEISECKVVVPAKCTVKEPIIGEATFEGAEKLGAEENEMGQEFKGKGAEETWGEITYEGGECKLNAKAFKLKGSAVATSGPGTEAVQTNQFAGSTLVFTAKNKMQNLKLGAEPAELSTITTLAMSGIGNNPIAFTTVT